MSRAAGFVAIIVLFSSGLTAAMFVDAATSTSTRIPPLTATSFRHVPVDGPRIGTLNWVQVTDKLPVSPEEAVSAAGAYLARYANPDLALGELTEYDNNFEFVVMESSTGRRAFEFLLDRSSGTAGEAGPALLWNTKYSRVSAYVPWWTSGGVAATIRPLTSDQARALAQSHLSEQLPGGRLAARVARYYGYLTFGVKFGGEAVGMLSVNEYTGNVWYHDWHGIFLREKALL